MLTHHPIFTVMPGGTGCLDVISGGACEKLVISRLWCTGTGLRLASSRLWWSFYSPWWAPLTSQPPPDSCRAQDHDCCRAPRLLLARLCCCKDDGYTARYGLGRAGPLLDHSWATTIDCQALSSANSIRQSWQALSPWPTLQHLPTR